ncbi:AIPR family protein [Thalassospira sp.]|uniref:AIPR family protein n=1 Tax=Thalassospira sp. TaxID=1912094 RepID=UPI000C363C9D|nr:AIPR family protein [Thalassospira sp.]MBC05467.1 hypothetical protein [Thalassospira sp.]|tara:strand:- start:3382 stop:5103 length:1722 start_codon:yes stop_codon:yes gene_type:complete
MSFDLKLGFVSDAIGRFSDETGLNDDDAFMYWFYCLIYDVEYDDVPLDEIVDGSGERQTDIFHIGVDESTQKVVVDIIQVKNTSGFSANTVSLMKAALDFIFKVKRAEYQKISNKLFVEKISNVREVIAEYGNTSVSVRCMFVTLGDEEGISEEALQNADNIRREFAESQVFGDFSFDFVGAHELNRLMNLRRNQKRTINYNLPIVYDANRASVVEFDAAGVKSLLCTVSGIELAKLAQSEPRDAVFDANVRGNLGLGGQVNKNIHESSTVEDKSKLFWFMNNGITMVCDHFDIVRDPDSPSVKIKNLQIINGCQTTSSIRSAYEDGVLRGEVKLQVKIYSSNDESFVNNVVIATNNQNSINTRDLHANDEIQQLIQQKIHEEFGLFYERKRGESKSARVSPSDVIKLEKAGQAYLAVFLRQPTVSRAQKYKVYSNELYSDIFGKAKPSQLVLAHELYKFCDVRGRRAYRELADSDPTRSILNYGVFHITRVLWWFIEQDDEMSALPILDLVNLIRSDDEKIEKAYEKAKNEMQMMLVENAEPLVNLNNYFKKSQSQQDINRRLKKKLEVNVE